MIQTLNLFQLRNGEFIQFFTDFISICNKTDLETMELKPQSDSLIELHSSLKRAYGKERGSDITAELHQIDHRRDKCISAIRIIADTYKMHYIPEVVDLATRLLDKIDSYGPNIARKNYQAETTVITDLTKSFESDEELKLALQKTSLTEWCEQLKAENELFNERFLARIDESANNNDETFKALRSDVIEAYKVFCNHLSAHVTLKGVEGYTELLNPVNSLIENYALMLKRRTSTTVEEETETKT